MFYSEIGVYTAMILNFNTHGSAQGFWNYENGEYYGDWTFTKD